MIFSLQSAVKCYSDSVADDIVVAHGFPATFWDLCLPLLLYWLNNLTLRKLTFCCGHSSNFVIQATLKLSLLTMIIGFCPSHTVPVPYPHCDIPSHDIPVLCPVICLCLVTSASSMVYWLMCWLHSMTLIDTKPTWMGDSLRAGKPSRHIASHTLSPRW